MLEIVKIINKDNVVVKVIGRLTTDNASSLASRLQEVCRETTDEMIIIDCEQLLYMSSAGLRILLQTRKQVGANRLKLINVTEIIYEILNVTGFDSFLTVERATV